MGHIEQMLQANPSWTKLRDSAGGSDGDVQADVRPDAGETAFVSEAASEGDTRTDLRREPEPAALY